MGALMATASPSVALPAPSRSPAYLCLSGCPRFRPIPAFRPTPIASELPPMPWAAGLLAKSALPQLILDN